MPYFQFFSRIMTAVCRLYLGDGGPAVEQLEAVVKEVLHDNFFHGLPIGNLTAALALIGRDDRARSLIPAVKASLPVSGRVNVHGAFFALDALVTSLMLLGERQQCGTFYPLTLDYIHTGKVFSVAVVGPSTTHLAAALAADAAGLSDRAHEHFETALRQSRELPTRIHEPMILYWYGRAVAATPDAAERSRGRAMIEAALTDFRSLGMPFHVTLAEAALTRCAV
jgi:hypothetical protein